MCRSFRSLASIRRNGGDQGTGASGGHTQPAAGNRDRLLGGLGVGGRRGGTARGSGWGGGGPGGGSETNRFRPAPPPACPHGPRRGRPRPSLGMVQYPCVGGHLVRGGGVSALHRILLRKPPRGNHRQ